MGPGLLLPGAFPLDHPVPGAMSPYIFHLFLRRGPTRDSALDGFKRLSHDLLQHGLEDFHGTC